MVGIVSKQMLEERSRLDARTQVGRHVAHVPVSNEERKKAKRLKASTVMTRTGDDFEDVVDNDPGVSNGLLNAKPRAFLLNTAESATSYYWPFESGCNCHTKKANKDPRKKYKGACQFLNNLA
ncbi:uncharacterized protein [Physcomitrium patens]|uniref:uncharacterized protein isoform X1 n=1 Tax=Physcomitrium patens TaxID=3218 RepID=UPI003CCDF774